MIALFLALTWAATPSPIATNQTWEVLDGDLEPIERVAQAAMLWDHDWEIDIAGVMFNTDLLRRLGAPPEDEPPTRWARELLKRPVDLTDLSFLLDDVLAAGKEGREGEPFHIHAGRARKVGVLIHPKEVFNGKRYDYPKKGTLDVDEPAEQETYEPAQDGALLGPEWTMRFRNPTEMEAMYASLAAKRPTSGFASRVATLIEQLERQGCEVYLTSFMRFPERGYLMWGAFILSRSKSEAELQGHLATLADRKTSWNLKVDIAWEHPDGWEATKEAARRMADAYDVVYATENGAKSSNHYDGVAADFVVLGLPRELVLHAPDGESHTFDLSDPNETRDLSMSPTVIPWIEEHFDFKKLKSDYPHWNDARKR